jgi:uncharacterized protein YjlB
MQINPEARIEAHLIRDNGTFPNSDRLPLLVYKKAFLFNGKGDPAVVEKTFATNGWTGSWRNGLYPYHHYHSTAHEVLGIYGGSVRVQFGGDDGITVVAEAGDVLVLPAGLAHKNLWSSHDFRVVGAYPKGTSRDMNYGKEGERPGTDANIARVPLPGSDPVQGRSGALPEHWKA